MDKRHREVRRGSQVIDAVISNGHPRQACKNVTRVDPGTDWSDERWSDSGYSEQWPDWSDEVSSGPKD